MSLAAADFFDTPDHELIGVFMEAVLERVEAVFEQAGVDLPERRFITIGSTAHDCAQVSVSFRQLYSGTPGAPDNQPFRCNDPRTIVLVLEVVRKVAISSGRGTAPPSASSLTSHAHEKTADAYLLLEAARTAVGDDTLAVADVAVSPPQADYQATILNMSVMLP